MKKTGFGIFFLCLLAATTFLYPKIQKAEQPELHLHRLPSTLSLLISSFGNRELMATFIFYNTEFYYGEKAGFRKESPELKLIYDALNKATQLDPRNMDCYYFAQGTLSLIKPAIPVLNRILEKGFKYRPWDWYLPFFIGANYYFQLNDPIQGAKFMQEAAKLNPTPLLSTLAARMLYEGDQTQSGIIYLKSLIKDTQNPLIRKKFKKRLQALEAIYFLENAVKQYKQKTGTVPSRINDLVNSGIIKNIPVDPYGGNFYIEKNGRIYTTSKLAQGWRKDENHNNESIKKSIPKRGS